MYRTLTVAEQGLITGVHESLAKITQQTFAENPAYAGQALQDVPWDAKVYAGTNVAEYDAQWQLKPDAWRIQQGYLPLPPGYELVGDQLVEKAVPPAQAPPTLQEQLERAQQQAAAAEQSRAIQDARIKALTDQNDFYADLIQEMALIVYA